jgi:choline dehydrogenase-like flavoprotein
VSIDRAQVAAFVDLLVPQDEYPSASQAGVVDALLASVEGSVRTDLLEPGFAALADESVDDLLAGRTAVPWPVDSAEFAQTMIRLVAEQYYGARDAPGWAMVGYDPGPRRDAGLLGPSPSLPTRRLSDVGVGYDVVVVGAGAGGGVAASVLTRAGLRVLLLERGSLLTYDQVGRDHPRNFRVSRYGHNTPPYLEDAGPRVVVDPDGTERVEPPWGPGYSALPHTVGGGTRVYQGMAWRLTPEDFRLATIHGVPSGSSLSDWPFPYDDLEPFYTRAEHEIGVCGDGTAHRNQGPRSADYPMPPLPDNTEAALLRRGAERLGLTTGPVPLLINSVPRGGRGRCVQCGECVGFACPSDAKNGPYNSVLPSAVADGCVLVTGARVLEVLTGPSGTVTGVLAVDEATGSLRTVRAGHVVLACSAIETARLLLASRSDAHPDGLGNHTDQVGRHLQGHPYVGGVGLFDHPVIDGPGPNVRIATCDYVNRLPGAIGGGVLANEVIKLPIAHWLTALPPEAPRWGLAGKHAMRDLYRRTSHVIGPVQEVPMPDLRITLDPRHVDRHRMPVARLSGRQHPETVAAARLQETYALEWLEASGATRVWPSGPIPTGVTAGQHQAGTCRMGDDPATSVTDPHGRVHGHRNLWVMDGSVHVTNGGFNPVLTILALAYRSAEHLAVG